MAAGLALILIVLCAPQKDRKWALLFGAVGIWVAAHLW